jgi:hypothetical protein
MAIDETHRQPSRVLRILVPILGSDLIDVLGVIWRFARQIVASRAHEGMYEVLDYEARLELLDTKGEKAVLHKRQRVRFLQDNIIAYQDKAWGDGEIFADYSAHLASGDRYREGHRWRILISCARPKKQGDEEEFRIERTIHRGFTKAVEDYQTEIDHATHRLSVGVVFPNKRPPKAVTLIEQNSTHTQPLGADQIVKLPDGRYQVRWSTDRPRLFEAYILRWEW